MKVFKAEFHFALPDDFQGTLADALRHLADFVEQEQLPRDTPRLPRDTSRVCYGASWSQFEHNLRTAACRFTGKTSLAHLPDGQPWQRMPQGIVDAVHDEIGAAWLK